MLQMSVLKIKFIQNYRFELLQLGFHRRPSNGGLIDRKIMDLDACDGSLIGQKGQKLASVLISRNSNSYFQKIY